MSKYRKAQQKLLRRIRAYEALLARLQALHMDITGYKRPGSMNIRKQG